jgi:hypothetical protein
LVVTETPTWHNFRNARHPILNTPTAPNLKDSLTLTDEMPPTLVVMLTNTTLTAEMGLTLAAIPSNAPPPWATIIPAPGDLGWGSVYGIIVDGATNLPLEGATVTCEHFSDTSPYHCNGITTTNSDGIYTFTGVFFRDTDRITLFVEAPGYAPLRFEVVQALIPPANFRTDLGLFPVINGSLTPTPVPFTLMCTPPACSDGVLVCGDPSGCLGGCGAICLPSTPTPP